MATAVAAPHRRLQNSAASVQNPQQQILQIARQYWGFESLRPLQREAIDAALAGRDSLVVMPTGGGKSLCYQVPPAMDGGTDVVVSPLISLMKDQIDGLKTCGYPSAAIHSGLETRERNQIEQKLPRGEYRLLFIAPERLTSSWFLDVARRLNVRRFAIDEAHCISHWGHDFRPEYRQLARLREQFPTASFHAFTATATPRVREDIVSQLGLRDPEVLVGSFDRPNLTYRVLPSVDVAAQVFDVITRHANEAVIVYCISRKDTEHLAATLQANGIKAAAYHAGLEPRDRRRVQDAFAKEELNVVVATVAFGMGIDRSNVRCVLHTAMPKTIEHYQQETGRAGRDGLEAECVLLYSAADAMRWERLITKSAVGADAQEVVSTQVALLRQMQRICTTPTCRHRSLVEYFGQTYEAQRCNACDVCLEDIEGLEDATVLAQKVLSCVARVEQKFGIGHVVEVLTGAETDAIRRYRHDQLSTYGLLKDVPKKQLQSMIYQMIDQDLLTRTDGERPVVQLNEASRAVLRGERRVQLMRAKQKVSKAPAAEPESWENVDRRLFEHLRTWRTGIAREREVPPYVVLHDATLRALARVRPTRPESLPGISGMGEKRTADFGNLLIESIRVYCDKHQLTTDQASSSGKATTFVPIKPKSSSDAKARAMELFRQGMSLDDVKHTIGRARSTTASYLAEFIAAEKPTSINPWVDARTYRQVKETAATMEDRRLSSIFQRLDGRVPYETIRLVLAHIEFQAE